MSKNTQIQFKRGALINLPQLAVAEMAFTTDTKQLFVGNGAENLQVALLNDVTASLNAAKSYTDAAVTILDEKIQGEIAEAITASKPGVATADADGLMSKEDKAAFDAIKGKEATWDDKETVEGAQAKADQAEANAKAHAKGLVDKLVDGAPEALDTIKELADALTSLKQEDVNGLLDALSGKAEKEHTHAATDIIESADKRFVSDTEKAAWNGKAEVADVTNAVSVAQTALQGNIDTLAGRVATLEAVAVIDGGTF